MSSPDSPTLPPPPRSRVPLLATAIGALVCFALLALSFEGSALGSFSGVRLRWGDGEAPFARDVVANVTTEALAADATAQASTEAPGLSSSVDNDDAFTANMTVPPADRLHLSLLQAACLKYKNSGIPWTFGHPGAEQESTSANEALLLNRDDPNLVEHLRQCPDVDVYLPEGLRGHGYCEDAVAYAKYLETRLLPQWVFDTPLIVDAERNESVMYHELCPHTAVILFNHYWDDLPASPHWPATKRVFLMPNIEMYELDESYLWHVDAVLCKTRVCAARVHQWYAQEGNPRGAQVLYTRHTTSDVAHFARHTLGDAAIASKDFANVKFLHTAGSSSHKGTRQTVECWLSRPDLPLLDVIISAETFSWMLNSPPEFAKRVRAAKNVRVTHKRVAPLAFGKSIAEASFFLCPSVMEGYGHYINQARASGGVIVTTNAPPMNELLTATHDTGVFVTTTRAHNANAFLDGASDKPHALRAAEGLSASFTPDAICAAVDHVVLGMSVRQREAMARRAQQQYHVDTAFFANAMRELRAFARISRQESDGSNDDDEV